MRCFQYFILISLCCSFPFCYGSSGCNVEHFSTAYIINQSGKMNNTTDAQFVASVRSSVLVGDQITCSQNIINEVGMASFNLDNTPSNQTASWTTLAPGVTVHTENVANGATCAQYTRTPTTDPNISPNIRTYAAGDKPGVCAVFVNTDPTAARTVKVNSKLIGYVLWVSDYLAGDPMPSGAVSTRVQYNGTVTIPANCTVSVPVTITLPDTYDSDYVKAGAGGTVGTGKTQAMTVNCSGGTGSDNLTLALQGAQVVGGTDIGTGNPDVGVRILNDSGETISAQAGTVPLPLTNGSGTISLTYKPTSVTGKAPSAGTFTALATITANIP